MTSRAKTNLLLTCKRCRYGLYIIRVDGQKKFDCLFLVLLRNIRSTTLSVAAAGRRLALL